MEVISCHWLQSVAETQPQIPSRKHESAKSRKKLRSEVDFDPQGQLGSKEFEA
jgi:hypothetical protein